MARFFTILIVAFVSSVPACSQPAATDTIEWKTNYQLSLNDFQLVSDTSEKIPENRQAVTRTILNYRLDRRANSNNFTIRLSAAVIKHNSFMKQNVLEMHPASLDHLLHHEQKHFDISEIFAREAVRIISAKRFSKNFSNEVYRIMHALNEEWKAWHKLYDNETLHGYDRQQQKQWDEKIDTKLKELEPFKNKALVKRIY